MHIGIASLNTTNNTSLLVLKGRWLTISAAVSQFCGIKAQQDRLRESGKTEADRMKKSIEIFDSESNTGKWNYTHCWQALSNNKKWEDYKSDKDTQSSKGLKLKSVKEGEAEPSDIKRPMGRDSAKKRRSGTPSDSESQCLEVLQHIMNREAVRKADNDVAKEEQKANQKLKLQLLQKQTEMQERQAELQEQQAELQMRHLATIEAKEKRKDLETERSIMDIDLDSLSGFRRAYYNKLQERILARIQKDDDQGLSA
ncbi:hypothetical protein BS78_05G231200 [Paspalum vaginatum]|nr:hypothetical protein BS78_05G231200 [Paspalum vaginatum]